MEIKSKKNLNNTPAKHSESSFVDRAAISILKTILNKHKLVAPDIKEGDTWPNEDGRLQVLGQESGIPFGDIIVQVKTLIPKKTRITHTLDDKFIAFANQIHSNPVVVIVVDIDNECAYWSEVNANILEKIKGKTISFTRTDIISKVDKSYYKKWKKLLSSRKAEQIIYKWQSKGELDRNQILFIRENYEDVESIVLSLPKDIQPLFTSYIYPEKETEDANPQLKEANLKKVKSTFRELFMSNDLKLKYLLPILDLVSPIFQDKRDFNKHETIRSLFEISEEQEDNLISKLVKKDTIDFKDGVCLIKDKKTSEDLLVEMLQKEGFDVENFIKIFYPMNKEILKKLVRVKNKVVQEQLSVLTQKQMAYIKVSQSNDEVFILLESLKEYSYQVPDEAIQISRHILEDHKPIPTLVKKIRGLGNVSGKSNDDLIIVVMQILQELRYLAAENVVKLVLPFSINRNKQVENAATDVLVKTAEYNLDAIKQIGYAPQLKLTQNIDELKDQELVTYFEPISKILAELFGQDMEGIEMTDEKTMNISFSVIHANEDTRKIRDYVIDKLTGLYKRSKNKDIRIKIVSLLCKVSQVSLHGTTEELETLMVENINKVVQFFISILPEADLSEIKIIDKNLGWLKKRFGEKIRSFDELKSLVQANTEYEIFKTLVGRDMFDEEYDRLSWSEAEKRNIEKINHLIAEVDDKSISKWKDRINTIVDAYKNNNEFSEFWNFRTFLGKLSKEKPEISMHLLDTIIIDNDYFLAELLKGIWIGNKSLVEEMMVEWIKEGKHLIACAHAFDQPNKVKAEILMAILDKGKDEDEVLNTLAYILKRSYIFGPSTDAKEMLIKVIIAMTKNFNTNWAKDMFYEEGCILDAFNESDWEVVVANLVYVTSLDYHVLEVLKPLIKIRPKLVVKLLKERVIYSRREDTRTKDFAGRYYDAIPHGFDNLRDELREIKEILIPEVLSWYDEKGLAKYDSGSLLNDLFTINELDVFLLDEKGQFTLSENQLVSLLYSYQGHISIESKFIQKYISVYINDKKKINEIMSLMSMSGGVVTGEYGFADSLETKLQTLTKFGDKGAVLNKFVEMYSEFLEKSIKLEIKKTDEEVTLRKQAFQK